MMDGQDYVGFDPAADRLGYDELRAAVRTEAGIVAVLQSITAGDPAVKRVHGLLVERFGGRYLDDATAVLSVGVVVAELMREFGFVEDRRQGVLGSAEGGLRWRLPSTRR